MALILLLSCDWQRVREEKQCLLVDWIRLTSELHPPQECSRSRRETTTSATRRRTDAD